MVGVYVPKNWKKVCAGLEIVQYAKKGDPFGGAAPRAEDVMKPIEDDDDDDDI